MGLNLNENMILAESEDLALLESEDQIVLNENGDFYIRSFTDDLIHETFLNVINKGLRFYI
jgi:hypothetical protein